MIVWLNGAFGVGKTSVGAALQTALPGAVVFDPEVIGWLLRRAVKVPTGDYQDLRSWRRLVVATAATLDRLRSGPVVVPMSLLRDRSTAEILETLRARGLDVRHVLLDLSSEALRRRIAGAPTRGVAEEATTAWRHAHVQAYERARQRLAACADVVIDTTGRCPEEVAAAVLEYLSGRLPPAFRRGNGGPRTGRGRTRPPARTPRRRRPGRPR